MGERVIKVAMLGFGHAGRAFAEMLLNKEQDILTLKGSKILVTAVATGTRGNLVEPKGIHLKNALQDIADHGVFNRDCCGYSALSTMDIVEKAEYDVLVELTPLNIFTGQPAIDHIRCAMNRGKHVITANKGPIAWAYRDLKTLSLRRNVQFLYETTVMDGTPVFNLVEETLPLCKVLSVKGILNSTTNFILDEMAKGKAYDEILVEGKNLGFVEADPAMDIEGWDAAAKTAALINVLMQADITPKDIKRQGIEHIRHKDVYNAQNEGKVIRLVCRGYREGGIVKGEVKPETFKQDELFANIKGTSSVVSITTDLMGEVIVIEQDPEIMQTGYGIFSDLMRLLDNTK